MGHPVTPDDHARATLARFIAEQRDVQEHGSPLAAMHAAYAAQAAIEHSARTYSHHTTSDLAALAEVGLTEKNTEKEN